MPGHSAFQSDGQRFVLALNNHQEHTAAVRRVRAMRSLSQIAMARLYGVCSSLPPHRCVLASCGSYRCFGTAAAVADENTAHFHPAERDDQPAYSHFFDRGHTPHFSSAFTQVQGPQENRAPTHQAAASTPGETLHDQYLKAYLSLDPKMRETHFHADTEGLNLATLQAMEVVEEARNSPLSETVCMPTWAGFTAASAACQQCPAASP